MVPMSFVAGHEGLHDIKGNWTKQDPVFFLNENNIELKFGIQIQISRYDEYDGID